MANSFVIKPSFREKLTWTYAEPKLHDDDMTECMTSHVTHDFSKLCHTHNCKQMLCQRLLVKTKMISQGTYFRKYLVCENLNHNFEKRKKDIFNISIINDDLLDLDVSMPYMYLRKFCDDWRFQRCVCFSPYLCITCTVAASNTTQLLPGNQSEIVIYMYRRLLLSAHPHTGVCIM